MKDFTFDDRKNNLKTFTVEITVSALNSGAAKDLMLRQTMSEVGYCEIENISIFNEDGYDVTDEIETSPYYHDEMMNNTFLL